MKKTATQRVLSGLAVAATTAAWSVLGVAGAPAAHSNPPLDCPGGQYWEPSTNTCMPLGQGPTPLDCPPGQWWNPFGNSCRPLGQL